MRLSCKEDIEGSNPSEGSDSVKVKWLRCATVYRYGAGSTPVGTAIGNEALGVMQVAVNHLKVVRLYPFPLGHDVTAVSEILAFSV